MSIVAMGPCIINSDRPNIWLSGLGLRRMHCVNGLIFCRGEMD